jgi:hypothetical protein
MIFTDDPHRPGDIVEISLPSPGIGIEMQDAFTVEGIRVELEERFNVDGMFVWRAKFVDRLGYTVVKEDQIQVTP